MPGRPTRPRPSRSARRTEAAGDPRAVGGGVGGPFVAQAAVVAGSARDRRMLPSTRIQTELFPLTSFALAGMMVFVSANNLLVMFVALEVLSLPLYLLCGLARRRRRLSQEAA